LPPPYQGRTTTLLSRTGPSFFGTHAYWAYPLPLLIPLCVYLDNTQAVLECNEAFP
jgi:hypothetical protein